MELIKAPLSATSDGLQIIKLTEDRRTLAKRRWRGTATDGTEFGFDLENPLRHGEVIHFADGKVYQIEQVPENVLRVAYTTPHEAAHNAWQVGNLHFQAQFRENSLLVEDDPAIRQMLDRLEVPYTEVEAVFEPVKAAGAHSHSHSHEHSHSHSEGDAEHGHSHHSHGHGHSHSDGHSHGHRHHRRHRSSHSHRHRSHDH